MWYWWIHQLLENNRGTRSLLNLVVLILTLGTLGAGLLMGFSGYNNPFEAANPALYDGLIHFF